MHCTRWLAFILGCGWAADILGQGRTSIDQTLELEPVVVTATVAPTALGRTTAPVAVARADLAVNWTLTRHWQVFLAVDNLFDTAYEEFVGFPAPGISPRAGVRASF